MAEVACGCEDNTSILTLCLDGDLSISCINCVSLKEQLCSALMDLKSARAIITLQEDINKLVASRPTNAVKPTLISESSVCDSAEGNWLPVICNQNRKLKKPVRSLSCIE
jgi:hypothetical protein